MAMSHELARRGPVGSGRGHHRHQMLKSNNTRKLQAPESEHHSSTWRTKCDSGDGKWSAAAAHQDKRRRPGRGGRLPLLPLMLALVLVAADLPMASQSPSPSASHKLQLVRSRSKLNTDKPPKLTRSARDVERAEAQGPGQAQMVPLGQGDAGTGNSSNGDQDQPAQQQQQQQPPSSDEHTNEFKIILTFVYLVIFVIGVCGNVCNCLVIADSRNRYMKTATNYYLFSLSISDLLLLIFGLPHDIVNLWHQTPYLFNSFVCISRGWISEASTYASVLVIVAFTVERYLAICHPLKAHTLSRLSRSVKIIIIIWLVASSCALKVAWQFGVLVEEVYVPEAAADEQDSLLAPTTTSSSSIISTATATQMALNGSESVATSLGTPSGASSQRRPFRPIAKCTVVELDKRVFEASVIIFFIIPMSLITILYIKLGHRLSQKTTVLKRNRLNRERHLSQRLGHSGGGRGELYSTGGVSVSGSHSPSSSNAFQSTVGATKISLAETELTPNNNNNNNTCCSIVTSNDRDKQPRQQQQAKKHRLQAVRIRLTSTTPASIGSDATETTVEGNKTEAKANEAKQVFHHDIRLMERAHSPPSPAAYPSKRKLCLCCVTAPIVAKPVSSLANGANNLNCRKSNHDHNGRPIGAGAPCLSMEEGGQADASKNENNNNNNGNNKAPASAAKRADSRQGTPIDGSKLGPNQHPPTATMAGANTPLEKRKPDGKLRHKQRDLLFGASKRQQSEEQMIDKASVELGAAAVAVRTAFTNDGRQRKTSAPNEAAVMEKGAASDNNTAASRTLQTLTPNETKMDELKKDDATRGSIVGLAPLDLEAKLSIEQLGQIVIGDGVADSRICMQQTIFEGANGDEDGGDDDGDGATDADGYGVCDGDDLRKALGHFGAGPTGDEQLQASLRSTNAGRPTDWPAGGGGQAPATEQQSLNNGLVQERALESVAYHHYRNKEQLLQEQRHKHQQQQHQQNQQQQARETTMQMKNVDDASSLAGALPAAASAITKTAKQRQASSELVALNSTVNTSSMKSVIKMLVSVVVMFFICWAPFHAQRLMAIYCQEPTKQQVFLFSLLNDISGISYYISAVANPILYSLFSMRFRQAFRDTFSSMNLCPAFVLGGGGAAGVAAT